MELEYASLLSPNPIKLSLGFNGKTIHLRKPKLVEIDEEISLQQFSVYEMFLKMTPDLYYTKIIGAQGSEFWDNLNNEQKNEITIYQIILNDRNLQEIYEKVFNFFFLETVKYIDGFFVFIDSKESFENLDDETVNNSMCGLIHEKNFNEFLYVIQQTCCISNGKPVETVKFKNEIARKLYEKMQKANAENEKKKAKEADKNLSLANIISKVSNKHLTISPITVWDLTIFQLIDAFNSMQVNETYETSKVRVAVWGDEKNTFDASLWYKNNHDK